MKDLIYILFLNHKFDQQLNKTNTAAAIVAMRRDLHNV